MFYTNSVLPSVVKLTIGEDNENSFYSIEKELLMTSFCTFVVPLFPTPLYVPKQSKYFIMRWYHQTNVPCLGVTFSELTFPFGVYYLSSSRPRKNPYTQPKISHPVTSTTCSGSFVLVYSRTTKVGQERRNPLSKTGSRLSSSFSS